MDLKTIQDGAEKLAVWEAILVHSWILLGAFWYVVNGFRDGAELPVRDRIARAAMWALAALVLLGGAAGSYLTAPDGAVDSLRHYASYLITALLISLFFAMIFYAARENRRFWRRFEK